MMSVSNTTVPVKVQLDTILSHHGEAYRKTHKLPLQQIKTLFAIEACRSAALGAHTDVCNACNHTRITYNSCRNRHCPKCQMLNKEKWVEKLSSRLLPVRYFHIVFTLPAELNRLCLVNQKVLYDLLFHTASQTIITLSKDKKHLGALSGLVAVLHTWGQTLTEHPHLHTLVPAGGWSQWNGYWKSSGKKFFISVKVLSRLFRGKFLAGLKTAYLNGELKFEGELQGIKRQREFKQLLDILYLKEWVVFAKAPFKNASAIVRYLGNYTHRVAISNDRIQKMENNKIIFRYKDYKDKGSKKMMTLDADEFIRRFLLHVLPHGFCKIRYYGLLSSRHRQGLLLQCKKSMGIKDRKSRFEGLTWQEILKVISGFDVTKCPCCNNGQMIPSVTLKGERSPPI